VGRPGDGNLISGNLVSENRPNHCAIVISSYNQGEGVKNNIVSDNVVVDQGEGTSYNVVSYNTVVDNTAGIIVAADTPNTIASYNTVVNNNILNNGEGGVIVHSNAPGDVVVGNVISGNVFTANGYLPTLEGVILGGEGPVAVQNTTVINNFFENEAIGIQIVNAKTTFVGGNIMELTVKLPINGTVININQAAGPSSVQTTTVGTTITATPTAATTAESAPAQTGSPTSGGLSLSLALVTAIGTLIVGLIIGIVVRPFAIERQHGGE
jgi:hypothetical protein